LVFHSSTITMTHGPINIKSGTYLGVSNETCYDIFSLKVTTIKKYSKEINFFNVYNFDI